MSKIKRYDFDLKNAVLFENPQAGKFVKFEDVALIEARCKELESVMGKVLDELVSKFSFKIELIELIHNALSTPTTDEHLHKLFNEWLGEPVKLKFPTMLRKMWSGAEVQQWLDERQPLYSNQT